MHPTNEGVLYLSMVRDLYDNCIVAYKTAAQQTVNLVLNTIRLAMKTEKKRVAAELQLHSDKGVQYTSHAYFNLTYIFYLILHRSRPLYPNWRPWAATAGPGTTLADPETLKIFLTNPKLIFLNCGPALLTTDHLPL